MKIIAEYFKLSRACACVKLYLIFTIFIYVHFYKFIITVASLSLHQYYLYKNNFLKLMINNNSNNFKWWFSFFI